MAITSGTILLLAILTLMSCVRRHSSRNEAQKASIAWINQGGTVTVLTLPNENEIKAQWRRERIVENNKCEFAKQEIEDLERSLSPDHFDENEIQAKYKDLISTREETCRDRKIGLADKQEEKNENARTTNNQCNSSAQKKIYQLARFQKKNGMNGQEDQVTLHINNTE